MKTPAHAGTDAGSIVEYRWLSNFHGAPLFISLTFLLIDLYYMNSLLYLQGHDTLASMRKQVPKNETARDRFKRLAKPIQIPLSKNFKEFDFKALTFIKINIGLGIALHSVHIPG